MKILKLSECEKSRIFTQASIMQNLSPNAIEKDWWVTMVLRALFSTSFASHLSFKGGTSLSKCWKIICRFSEDVDIAIDREFLGFYGNLSKTQISDKLRRSCCSFVRETIKDELTEKMISFGVDPTMFSVELNVTTVTTTDPEIIIVRYFSVFKEDLYIRNMVMVEVGGRSMTEPVENIEIKSIVAETFPDTKFVDKEFTVRAVSPKRTFLEKAFLLHEEFKKTQNEIRINRMSRHLYDLEKMMDTIHATEALADIDLYKSVVEHREKFIGLKGIDYSTLYPQTINFIPPVSVLKEWEEDYKTMQATMIYGESLSFSQLIERVKILNQYFRQIALSITPPPTRSSPS